MRAHCDRVAQYAQPSLRLEDVPIAIDRHGLGFARYVFASCDDLAVVRDDGQAARPAVDCDCESLMAHGLDVHAWDRVGLLFANHFFGLLGRKKSPLSSGLVVVAVMRHDATVAEEGARSRAGRCTESTAPSQWGIAQAARPSACALACRAGYVVELVRLVGVLPGGLHDGSKKKPALSGFG